ncbi:MAG: hypothetical protein ACTSYI_09270 [Promethearchaeota archaeon]
MHNRANDNNELTNLPSDVNLFPDNYVFPDRCDGVYENINHIWNSETMEFYAEGKTPKIRYSDQHYAHFVPPSYQDYMLLVERWEAGHPGQGGTSAPWFLERVDWSINPIWVDVEL